MTSKAKAAQLVFAEDFETLDWSKYTSQWWYSDPTKPGCSLPSNGELQLYVNKNGPLTAEPWTVSDSILRLTCSPVDPPVDDGYGNPYSYLSGMLNTYPSFWRTYGFFEVRAKMPPGAGLWPAFWLLPMDGAWPPEIDVVEWLGSEPQVRHCGNHSNSGGWHWTQDGSHAIPDGSGDFHDYGVDWQLNQIAFTFDGVTVASFPTPPDMHGPMYWILNLALGGWGGPPDDATSWPASLEIDWVRVYDVNPYADEPVPPEPQPLPPGKQYPLDNPWSAVDLTGVYQPGDRVTFNFAYDFYQVIFDGFDSYVWVRQQANLTLACVLPGRVDALGVQTPDQRGFGRRIGPTPPAK